MCILTSKEIRERIKNFTPPLIENYIDLDKQLQPAGFDMTLGKISIFLSDGAIDFTNLNRRLASTKEIEFDQCIKLKEGVYLVEVNEIVNIHRDLIAIAKPRSTLLRIGATISTAIWDPGYRGRSKLILRILNPHGIYLYKNARIMQMIFLKLCKPALKIYKGIYQDEGIGIA